MLVGLLACCFCVWLNGSPTLGPSRAQLLSWMFASSGQWLGFWRVSFYEAAGSVVHDGLVFDGDGQWKQEMVASWLRGEEPDFAGW